jgi:hypothetical protein
MTEIFHFTQISQLPSNEQKGAFFQYSTALKNTLESTKILIIISNQL